MTTPTAGNRPDRDRDDPDTIEVDLEHDRENLGDTIDALAEKFDVKEQARRGFEETKERATATAEQLKSAATTSEGKPEPRVLIAAGAAIAAVVVIGTLIRKRSR